MLRFDVQCMLMALVVVAGAAGCAAPSRHAPADSPEAPASPAQPALPSSTAAPSTADDEDVEDVETLEADLARDESMLRSLLAASSREQPAAVPPAEESGSSATGGAPKAAPVEREEGRCNRVCRALSSMRRSAEGICRLSGDDNERCERAQLRVDAASDLVRSAGCSC